MHETKEYKDNFFRALFGKWENSDKMFLDAYNAVFNTNLTLENTTITDASLEGLFYTKKRSDVAKFINGKLVVLFEQQSTINENMPLRCLEYVCAMYSKLLKKGDGTDDRYKHKRQEIPRPIFIEFYNGEDLTNDCELKLSNAFSKCDTNEVMLELKVKVLNINRGAAILQKSSALRDYTTVCDYIKDYYKEGVTNYVERGVQKAIDNGVLKECLENHFLEVTNMFEYDYETDLRTQKKECYEDGLQRGMQQGIFKMAQVMLYNGLNIEIVSKCTNIPIEQLKKINKEK